MGVNDSMGQVLWTRYFLEAQGYNVEDSIIYQDNSSSILLEKNGKSSSSKRTRHMNIRYFFITDKVGNKEIRVEYCPMEEMTSDYFTKPLQGALFRKMQDRIMNCNDNNVHQPTKKVRFANTD